MNLKQNLQQRAGFSILKLCTAISIFACLCCLIMPEYQDTLMRNERELVLDRLQIAIEFAKQEAFKRGKTVTLCASFNQKSCYKGRFTPGFIVTTEKELLQTFPPLKYGTLQFDHFGQFLQFHANGTSFNGTITYCPKNRNIKEANAIIINKAGRIYRPIKKNILGLFEKQEGTINAKPLTCG